MLILTNIGNHMAPVPLSDQPLQLLAGHRVQDRPHPIFDVDVADVTWNCLLRD